ncbi:peptidase M24 [Arthrobacter sp. Hiyo4]|nr:peptidase M24 [Arthrobacter sp. Hiyo4]
MSQTTTAATPMSQLTEPATVADQGRRTPPATIPDRAIKRGRVLDILDAKGRDSLLLTTHPALAWYLDGSRVHISLAGDPIAALLVGRDGDHLVTFNNETGRIAAEELPAGSPSTPCLGTGTCTRLPPPSENLPAAASTRRWPRPRWRLS